MAIATALILPAIAGGIVYLVGKSASYSQVIERLNYDLKPKFEVQTSGLVISVDFWLDNPTEETLMISYPLVMVYNGSDFITQNSVLNTKYTLKPKKQLTIPNITFKLSWWTLAQLLGQNILEIKNAVANNTINDYIENLKKNLTFTASFEVNGIPITYKDTLLGYAPLSAIDRKITAAPQFDKYFPLPQNRKQLVIDDGDVYDTVKKMHEIVNNDYQLVRNAALNLFKTNSVYDTSKKIFDFVYKYIKYNLEKGEQLRNPLVTYHLGQRLARDFYKKHGYYNQDYSADCDDIAIFVASILKNLGIPYAFRIASYRPGGNFSHVYVVAYDNGKPIIIDPVYHTFNAENM